MHNMYNTNNWMILISVYPLNYNLLILVKTNDFFRTYFNIVFKNYGYTFIM